MTKKKTISALSSEPVSCENIVLLCSWSLWQQRFRLSVTLHPDANYLANRPAFCNQTWYGDALSWHETEFHGKRLGCYFHGQGNNNENSCSQNMTVCCIFWTADPFATKLTLMVQCYHYVPSCLCEKIALLCWRWMSKKIQNCNQCLSGQYLLNRWNFHNQIWYGY